MTEMPELFEGMGVAERRTILSTACAREFGCRERIFWEGEPIKEIFLLTEGRVKVIQLSKDGREIILRLHMPGEIIGTQCLLPRGLYSETAQALQSCKTMAWSRERFGAILEHFPSVCANAQRIIAREITQLSFRICDIITGEVSWRLASGLLYLSGQIGREVEGHFELDVTQETVAEMTAMTVFTANRQLSQWEQQGLVKCLRKSIVIRDYAGLAAFCSNGRSHRAQVLVGRRSPVNSTREPAIANRRGTRLDGCKARAAGSKGASGVHSHA